MDANVPLTMLAEMKQRDYQEQRRVWTEMVRRDLMEQREYELFWQWEICGYYQEWTAKHG